MQNLKGRRGGMENKEEEWALGMDGQREATEEEGVLVSNLGT